MPSKSLGKKITKIKINKETVHISFEKGQKLIVTNEVMSNFYLYPGKELTNKEIKEIKEFSDNAIYLKYALSLIKKRHYSEWKMREKLYAKEASKQSVDKIIKILKNADLINDKMLAEDLKSYLEEKYYGKNKIINYLNNEGIFESVIKSLRFSDTNEKKKANANISKLEKRYAKYGSVPVKTDKLFNKKIKIIKKDFVSKTQYAHHDFTKLAKAVYNIMVSR